MGTTLQNKGERIITHICSTSNSVSALLLVHQLLLSSCHSGIDYIHSRFLPYCPTKHSDFNQF